jgi:hypothetical protein
MASCATQASSATDPDPDKPADAELCYRKAYEIATAVLEPDHPFVVTSRQNLNDFYKARGRAVEFRGHRFHGTRPQGAAGRIHWVSGRVR